MRRLDFFISCCNIIPKYYEHISITWWRHQMETFSALLAICAGNSPATGELPVQRPVTRSFDVFFDLHLNERWSKQSWGWWFETPLCPLWRHSNKMAFMSETLECFILQPQKLVQCGKCKKWKLAEKRLCSYKDAGFECDSRVVQLDMHCVSNGYTCANMRLECTSLSCSDKRECTKTQRNRIPIHL